MYYRKWLNKQGRAFIEINAPNSTDIDVTIGDCSRTITLDFSIWGSNKQKAAAIKRSRIKKLNILIDSLYKLKEELENN